jgi:hypothetical protein
MRGRGKDRGGACMSSLKVKRDFVPEENWNRKMLILQMEEPVLVY